MTHGKQLQITGFQMCAEIAATEWFTGGLRNQLFGGKAATVLPDVLA
jgi:hypothetical protein